MRFRLRTKENRPHLKPSGTVSTSEQVLVITGRNAAFDVGNQDRPSVLSEGIPVNPLVYYDASAKVRRLFPMGYV